MRIEDPINKFSSYNITLTAFTLLSVLLISGLMPVTVFEDEDDEGFQELEAGFSFFSSFFDRITGYLIADDAEILEDANEINDWYDLNATRDNLTEDYILMNDLDSETTGYEGIMYSDEHVYEERTSYSDGDIVTVRYTPIDEVLEAKDGDGNDIDVEIKDAYEGTIQINEDVGWGNNEIIYKTSEEVRTGWEPLGMEDPFTGIFDGNNHSISDLVIDKPEKSYVGLFGHTEGADIQNINLKDVEVFGGYQVGSLAGYVDGTTITNSHVSGHVSGQSDVGGLVGELMDSNVSNSGSHVNVVETRGWAAGGIVGYAQDVIIENSYATGDVRIAQSWAAGGIVGYGWPVTIKDSYSTGDIIGRGTRSPNLGGLSGYSSGDIINSYATGSIEWNEYGADVGGLTGHIDDDSLITGSYWNKETTGVDFGVGNEDDDIFDGLYGRNTNEMTWNDTEGGYGWDGGTHRDTYGGHSEEYSFEADAGWDEEWSEGDVIEVHDFFDVIDGNTSLEDGDGNSIDHSFDYEDNKFLLDEDSGERYLYPYLNHSVEWNMSTTHGETTWWSGDHEFVEDTDEESGYPALKWKTEARRGTEPIPVEDWDDLNRARNSFSYILANDLNQTTEGYDDFVGGNKDKGWSPIGNWDVPYSSTFDGGGHTVSGLEIDRPEEEDMGLFGITIGADVYNITLEDVDITGEENTGSVVGYAESTIIDDVHATGTVTSGCCAGGLSGYMELTEISDSSADVDVVEDGDIGSAWTAGGLVGWMEEGIIDSSHAMGDVTVEGRGEHGWAAGGLVGSTYPGTIRNSYATGDMVINDPDWDPWVGGLVGDLDDGSIESSYAVSPISGDLDAPDAAVGGLVGGIDESDGEVIDSYWNSDIEGVEEGIGLEDDADYGVHERNTTKMTWDDESEEYPDAYDGWNFDKIWMDGDHAIVVDHRYDWGYPALQWQEFVEPPSVFVVTREATDVTPESTTLRGELAALEYDNADVYFEYRKKGEVDWDETDPQEISEPQKYSDEITDLEEGQMYEFRAFAVSEGEEYYGDIHEFEASFAIENWFDLNKTRDNLEEDYILIDDLDSETEGYEKLVGTEEGWEPIPGFQGSFDGRGHVISDLFISRSDSDYVGLFGTIEDSTVKNVGLENVDIMGDSMVGGLSGKSVNGFVLDSYVTGDVSGEEAVGGLIGTNDGGISNSYSLGIVQGRDNVGGLLGVNENTVSSSYSRAAVQATGQGTGGLVGLNDGGSVSGSYTSGFTKGSSSVGGLVGSLDEGQVSKSYSSSNVKGGGRVGGLLGVTDSDTSITNSYSTGSVEGSFRVGGLVGYLYEDIHNSYSTGGVKGGSQTGGLVGYGHWGDAVVYDSYWNIDTSGQRTSDMEETGSWTGQMTDYPDYDHAYDGWDFAETWKKVDWNADQEWNTGYPALEWQNENQGPFMPRDPSPDNDVVGVSGNIELSVLVGHREDQGMNVTFYDAFGDEIGTVYDAESGERASVEWKGLSENELYGWYAEVEDGEYSETSPTWTFETAVEIENCQELQAMEEDLTAAYALADDIDCSVTEEWNKESEFTEVLGQGEAYEPGDIVNLSYKPGDEIIESNYDVQWYNSEESMVEIMEDISSWSTLEITYNTTEEIVLGFDPVGDEPSRDDMPFVGHFNGRGYEISNLYINRPDEDGVALFGWVGEAMEGGVSDMEEDVEDHGVEFGSSPTIKNLYMDGIDITGGRGVGSVLGMIPGELGGPAVRGEEAEISIGSIEVKSSFVNGVVSGDESVGGLIGFNNMALIDDSYTDVIVSGSREVGGVVGTNQGGKISYTHSDGSVTGDYIVGGLAGSTRESIVFNAYSDSEVVGLEPEQEGQSGTGGLIGVNEEGFVYNSYATGDVEGMVAGGLVGMSTAAIEGPRSINTGPGTTGLVYGSHATGNVEGIYAGGLIGGNNGPILVSSSYSKGDVVGEVAGSGLVGYNMYGSITESYYSGSVKVGVEGSPMVSESIGFDGDPLTEEESFAGGLVGVNEEGRITNTYVLGNITGIHDTVVGGLIGYSVMDEEGTFGDSYSSAFVQGDGDYTGGLVGLLDGEGGTIGKSYWNNYTSGQEEGVGNITIEDEETNLSVYGASTKDMVEFEGQYPQVYGDWDFEYVWSYGGVSDQEGNYGYPVLRWELYPLEVDIEGSGSVEPEVGMHSYRSGKQIDLTAEPSSGWEFDGWSALEEETAELRDEFIANIWYFDGQVEDRPIERGSVDVILRDPEGNPYEIFLDDGYGNIMLDGELKVGGIDYNTGKWYMDLSDVGVPEPGHAFTVTYHHDGDEVSEKLFEAWYFEGQLQKSPISRKSFTINAYIPSDSSGSQPQSIEGDVIPAPLKLFEDGNSGIYGPGDTKHYRAGKVDYETGEWTLNLTDMYYHIFGGGEYEIQGLYGEDVQGVVEPDSLFSLYANYEHIVDSSSLTLSRDSELTFEGGEYGKVTALFSQEDPSNGARGRRPVVLPDDEEVPILSVDVEEVYIELEAGENDTVSVEIANEGDSEANLSLYLYPDLDLIWEDYGKGTLEAGGTEEVDINFNVPEDQETGTYDTVLNIEEKQTEETMEIPITLKVVDPDRKQAFDASIKPNKPSFTEEDSIGYNIDLEVLVEDEVDASIEISILDERGREIHRYEIEETVEERYSESLYFHDKLEPGSYSLNMNVEPAPNIYRPSSYSSEFEVLPRDPLFDLWTALIGMILVLLIVASVYYIKKRGSDMFIEASVGEILSDPKRFDGEMVKLDCEVTPHGSYKGNKIYRIRDDTGTIKGISRESGYSGNGIVEGKIKVSNGQTYFIF